MNSLASRNINNKSPVLFSLLFIIAASIGCSKKENPVIKNAENFPGIHQLRIINTGFFTHQIANNKTFIAGSDGKIISLDIASTHLPNKQATANIQATTKKQWQAAETPGFNDKINGLAANDTGTILIAVGENGLIARSEDSGEHWEKLASPINKIITTIVFDSKHQHWIAAGEQGLMLYSNAAGKNWQPIPFDSTSTFSKIISFSTHLIAIGENGLIAQSTNGGMEWKIIPPVSTAALTDILAIDTQVLISTAEGNIIRGNIVTNHWELVTTGFSTYLSKIFYDNHQKIVLALSSDGDVFLSDDGGNLWAPVSQHNNYLNNIAQSNNGKWLLIVGDQGELLMSDNAGRTWTQQNSPVKINAEGVIPNNEEGFIVYGEAGLLMELKNPQSSWEIINFPVSEFVHQLLPVTSDNWIATGTKGAILESRDQGRTWQKATTQGQENDYFLSIVQDKKSGNVIIAGPPGTILLANPNDTQWRARLVLGDANQGYFHRVVSNDKGTIIAIAGPGQTHYSSDAGENWNTANINNSKQLFAAIYDQYHQQFVAVGQAGVIQLSPDGKHWTTMNSGVTQSLQTIYATKNALWAAGDNGVLIQSTDGGNTWQNTNTDSHATILALFETQDNSLLATGTQGYIARWNTQEQWQQIQAPTHTSLRMPVQDDDTGFIYIPGKNGDIIYSKDDGVNWNLLPPITQGSIKSLHIDNHNKMLIGVGERLMRIPLLIRNN